MTNDKEQNLQKDINNAQRLEMAGELAQNQELTGKPRDLETELETTEKILNDPIRRLLLKLHVRFIKLEKNVWEPTLQWANKQAWLSLAGHVGLIIATASYISSERLRRDAEVFTAWQVITSADGQPGNGGRIKALEFLNASPGSNWRRRFPWFCAPLPICTWPSENLQGINLSTPEGLSGAYLQRVQLPYADLDFADFQGADLKYANLSKASLSRANLQGSDLVYSNLKSASLSGADLSKADLASARLQHAVLRSAIFKNTILQGANLQEADLSNSNLQKANLAYTFSFSANFQSADLSNANFAGATLLQANFEGANLQNAIFNTIEDPDQHSRETDLRGAIFKESNLQNAQFIGVDLRQSKNLTLEQLQGEIPALLCGVALPTYLSQIDSNRDCERYEKKLLEQYEQYDFVSDEILKSIKEYVKEIGKKEWPPSS